jgi:hypothetical protein
MAASALPLTAADGFIGSSRAIGRAPDGDTSTTRAACSGEAMSARSAAAARPAPSAGPAGVQLGSPGPLAAPWMRGGARYVASGEFAALTAGGLRVQALSGLPDERIESQMPTEAPGPRGWPGHTVNYCGLVARRSLCLMVCVICPGSNRASLLRAGDRPFAAGGARARAPPSSCGSGEPPLVVMHRARTVTVLHDHSVGRAAPVSRSRAAGPASPRAGRVVSGFLAPSVRWPAPSVWQALRALTLYPVCPTGIHNLGCTCTSHPWNFDPRPVAAALRAALRLHGCTRGIAAAPILWAASMVGDRSTTLFAALPLVGMCFRYQEVQIVSGCGAGWTGNPWAVRAAGVPASAATASSPKMAAAARAIAGQIRVGLRAPELADWMLKL